MEKSLERASALQSSLQKNLPSSKDSGESCLISASGKVNKRNKSINLMSSTTEAISLFSGIGGFEIAFTEVFGSTGKIIQFVEINPDAQQVLTQRFKEVPIHDDIRSYIPPYEWGGILLLGFPCTGTSNAGKREGLAHPESNLWFDALRVIIISRPKFIVIENPEGLIHRGLRTVLGGLALAGYTWDDPQLLLAAWVGSPQRRNRLFLIGYANNLRQRFRQVPTSWVDQIRDELEAIHQSWGQTKSSSASLDDGFPCWMGGRSFDGWWRTSPAPAYAGMRRHTAKRRECNDLYARSVVPQVAAIALRRVKYLQSLICA